jgi:hypothetical protein
VYIATIVHSLYNFGYLPVGPYFDCSIYQSVVHLCCKLLLKRAVTRLLHVLISENVRGFAGKLLLLGYVSRNMRTAAASRNVLSPFHVFCSDTRTNFLFIDMLACLELFIGVFFVVVCYVVCIHNGSALPIRLPLRGSYREVLGRDIIALTEDT